jgi:hypothetical protein
MPNCKSTKYVLGLAVALLLALSGCTKPTKITGLDAEKFGKDPKGCNGYRSSIKPLLEAHLLDFKSLSEPEIIATLGPADRKDLSSRSQKYFLYYLSGAPDCPIHDSMIGRPVVLLIRFNSLNRVTESSIGLD